MTRLEDFEHPQIVHVPTILDKGPYPDDWTKWPANFRAASAMAVRKKLDEFPGSKIVAERSMCIPRGDLSGVPWMLYRSVTLEIPE